MHNTCCMKNGQLFNYQLTLLNREAKIRLLRRITLTLNVFQNYAINWVTYFQYDSARNTDIFQKIHFICKNSTYDGANLTFESHFRSKSMYRGRITV